MIFNEEEMFIFSKKLGQKLIKRDVLVLTGDLGIGKTTFTKGLGKGLGINQMIKSPTFTIVREYEGRLPLYHMDVYRIGNDSDSFDIENYFEADGICVIEWGELLGAALPLEYLAVNFERITDNKRDIQLIAHGKRYEELIENL